MGRKKRQSISAGPKGSAVSQALDRALSALRAYRGELAGQLEQIDRQIASLELAIPGRVQEAAPAPAPAQPAAVKAGAKRRGRPPKKAGAPKKTTKVTGTRQRRDGKKTLIQVIMDVLREKRAPMRPVEIARIVEDGKLYQSKTKNLYNAVMTNLVRSDQVKKLNDGRYAIK